MSQLSGKDIQAIEAHQPAVIGFGASTSRRQARAIISCGLLLVCCWIFFSVFCFDAVDKRHRHIETSLAKISTDVSQKADQFSRSVRNIEPIVEALAADIQRGTIKLEQIDARLQQDLGANPWMYGLGLALEPFQADAKRRLWSRYYINTADSDTVGALVESAPITYDYTQFKYDWYRKPLLEGKRWNEPYFGEASNTLIAEFGVPFWLPSKQPASDEPSGVIFGNLSINKLKNLIKLDSDPIAYYQILSKQGRFIAHPDEELELAGSTIFESAWQAEDTALNSMAVHAVAGEQGITTHTDTETGQQSWMIYQPMTGLDWSLIVSVDNYRLTNKDEMRRQWFLFTPQLVLCISLLIFFIVLTQAKPQRLYFSSSIIFSLIVSAGVLGLWAIAEHYPKQSDSNELKLISENVLNSFANKQQKIATTLHQPPPKFIPTGVYLQSVEFEGANNVKISGYVWQNYHKGEHKGISRGFVLPEAETPTVEEVYREMSNPDDPGCQVKDESLRDCAELVGWYVFATLRQEFDYSLYPLDSQQVWLRMWHQQFKDNILLVPDLKAYTQLTPQSTPGVQQGFVLPGWTIEESWFSINTQSFNTNFGSRHAHGLGHKPELYYNVSIQRKFMNPFVSRIIPVQLIAILMFLIVLISTKSSKAAEWLGFSASDVVLGLSALFFVVGINHSELRQSLQSSNIMYFEYFYFVIYVMLLYVAASAIYIAKRDAIDGRDENLISKIMYWPSLSLVLFAVTFGVFY